MSEDFNKKARELGRGLWKAEQSEDREKIYEITSAWLKFRLEIIASDEFLDATTAFWDEYGRDEPTADEISNEKKE